MYSIIVDFLFFMIGLKVFKGIDWKLVLKEFISDKYFMRYFFFLFLMLLMNFLIVCFMYFVLKFFFNILNEMRSFGLIFLFFKNLLFKDWYFLFNYFNFIWDKLCFN